MIIHSMIDVARLRLYLYGRISTVNRLRGSYGVFIGRRGRRRSLPGEDVLGMVVPQVHLCRPPEGDSLLLILHDLDVVGVCMIPSATGIRISNQHDQPI